MNKTYHGSGSNGPALPTIAAPVKARNYGKTRQGRKAAALIRAAHALLSQAAALDMGDSDGVYQDDLSAAMSKTVDAFAVVAGKRLDEFSLEIG